MGGLLSDRGRCYFEDGRWRAAGGGPGRGSRASWRLLASALEVVIKLLKPETPSARDMHRHEITPGDESLDGAPRTPKVISSFSDGEDAPRRVVHLRAVAHPVRLPLSELFRMHPE